MERSAYYLIAGVQFMCNETNGREVSVSLCFLNFFAAQTQKLAHNRQPGLL